MKKNSICSQCSRPLRLHSKDEAISCALKIIKVDIEADPKMKEN